MLTFICQSDSFFLDLSIFFALSPPFGHYLFIKSEVFNGKILRVSDLLSLSEIQGLESETVRDCSGSHGETDQCRSWVNKESLDQQTNVLSTTLQSLTGTKEPAAKLQA